MEDKEEDDDLVSLGSDNEMDDDETDIGDNSSAHESNGGDHGRRSQGARWHSSMLNTSALMKPVAPSRSFLTSAAAKAGGGAGALRNRKPAK